MEANNLPIPVSSGEVGTEGRGFTVLPEKDPRVFQSLNGKLGKLESESLLSMWRGGNLRAVLLKFQFHSESASATVILVFLYSTLGWGEDN